MTPFEEWQTYARSSGVTFEHYLTATAMASIYLHQAARGEVPHDPGLTDYTEAERPGAND